MIELVSDRASALDTLQVAFRACPKDFDTLKQEVRAGRVSLYRLTGQGYNVTVAGEIVGHSYFLWGVVGVGVVGAIRELKTHVKAAGLQSISAETYFPLVARLGRRLQTKEQTRGDVTRMEIKV